MLRNLAAVLWLWGWKSYAKKWWDRKGAACWFLGQQDLVLWETFTPPSSHRFLGFLLFATKPNANFRRSLDITTLLYHVCSLLRLCGAVMSPPPTLWGAASQNDWCFSSPTSPLRGKKCPKKQWSGRDRGEGKFRLILLSSDVFHLFWSLWPEINVHSPLPLPQSVDASL